LIEGDKCEIEDLEQKSILNNFAQFWPTIILLRETVSSLAPKIVTQTKAPQGDQPTHDREAGVKVAYNQVAMDGEMPAVDQRNERPNAVHMGIVPRDKPKKKTDGTDKHNQVQTSDEGVCQFVRGD